MSTGYVPSQEDLEAFWTDRAVVFSPENQLAILNKIRTYHSSVPIIPDERTWLEEKASAITGKYMTQPARWTELNSAQIRGIPALQQNISQAYELIEKHREAIRYLEDAITLGRTVIAIRERETSVARTRNAEEVFGDFLTIFITRFEEGI